MKQQNKQRGQVLVLIILAIAAIFGFAALAIDIGRTYSERRRAQSAADAAAYAAAFAATQGHSYLNAGQTSVRLNGFDDTDPGLNPAADVDVQIYNPPQSGKYKTATETIDPNEYFQVIIRQKVKPVFAQFVYQGPMELTVEAIARGTPDLSFASGASIVATCSDCCDAVRTFGTADINIKGGNIISNSLNKLGPDKCDAAGKDGGPCITLDSGKIITGGTFGLGKSTCKADDSRPAIIGGIEENSSNLWSAADPGPPGCVGLTEISTYKYNDTPDQPLSPGIYKNGISVSGDKTVVHLKPGMYCLDGDLSITSGSLMGSGVMFVMRKNSNININTDKPVVLSAPGIGLTPPDDCIPDPSISAKFCWSGILVYMHYDEHGTIHFAGGNTTSYTGTVYAPGPAKPPSKTKCTIIGNAESISVNSSIICYTVGIGGTGSVDLKYQSDANLQNSAIVELSK